MRRRLALLFGAVCVAALAAWGIDSSGPGVSKSSQAASSPAPVTSKAAAYEQGVIVSLPPPTGDPDDSIAIMDVEDAIRRVIVPVGGYVDGNEIGADGATVYSYGPDADKLWAAMQPTLVKLLPPGSSAFIQYSLDSPRNYDVPIN